MVRARCTWFFYPDKTNEIMLQELNKQLVEVKEKIRARDVARAALGRAQNLRALASEREHELERSLRKEGADVRKLEGLSLTALFHIFLGNKETRLQKERQEFILAKLRYDECREAIAALNREILEWSGKIGAFGDLDSQYRHLLALKENFIAQAGNDSTRKLIRLSEELADARSDVKELKEAFIAGDTVVKALQEVAQSLGTARGWGTLDLLGGGFVTTALKHSGIDSARAGVHRVQQLLRRFDRELADVGSRFRLEIDIGAFETFADFFFDGLIFDWVVQSRIVRSLENVRQTESLVNGVREKLRTKLETAEKNVVDISKRRRSLIEEIQ